MFKIRVATSMDENLKTECTLIFNHFVSATGGQSVSWIDTCIPLPFTSITRFKSIKTWTCPVNGVLSATVNS